VSDVERAIMEMFNLSDCDCDGGFERRRWPAHAHAGDCPVYVRYTRLEPNLRREAARLRRA
jgi:hypothetical protein